MALFHLALGTNVSVNVHVNSVSDGATLDMGNDSDAVRKCFQLVRSECFAVLSVFYKLCSV